MSGSMSPTSWALGTIVSDHAGRESDDGVDISWRAMVVGHTAKRVRLQTLGTERIMLAEPELLHGKLPALWASGYYFTAEANGR